MSLGRASKAIAELEAFHRRLVSDIEALNSKLPGVREADFETLVESLGGVDQVDALAEAMPDQPTVAEMVSAMGGAEALGNFAAQTLGGDIGAFAALADKGCNGDARALADIAETFADESDTLGNMLLQGGLKDHPEAFAQIFTEGCGRKADALLKFCQTFDSKSKRECLRDALDEGGLGRAPSGLGALAREDNGMKLLKVVQEANKGALGDLLRSGGP